MASKWICTYSKKEVTTNYFLSHSGRHGIYIISGKYSLAFGWLWMMKICDSITCSFLKTQFRWYNNNSGKAYTCTQINLNGLKQSKLLACERNKPHCFSHVELTLHSWGNPNLAKVYCFFIYCWILFTNILVRTFCIYIYEKVEPVAFLSFNVLVRLGSKCALVL